MRELKRRVQDAHLTTQDAWKLIARRRRLTSEEWQALMVKLAAARQFIDEALEELGAGAEGQESEEMS